MEENIIVDEYTSPSVIYLQEHGEFDDKEYIKKLGVKFEKNDDYEGIPKYLGICPQNLCASYYIGAEWLNEELALVVTPKMENIDYIEMFMCALKHTQSMQYFSKFYGIYANGKSIKTNAFNSLLTPLLVIHYLGLVGNIIEKGLRSDYIIREENLCSKIRGKIKVSQNIKYNNINKRNDRTYCQYQEYTVDTIENRVLKKALVFSKEIVRLFEKHSHELRSKIESLLTYFINVSDNVDVWELKNIRVNKIYKGYKEALNIAKMILQQYNYSLSQVHNDNISTPPFWIDMSRLYEVYVYSKLLDVYDEKQIAFQVEGYNKTAVDFIKIDEKVVIDTKYKPRYNDENAGILNDVRQISAYARDNEIIKRMGGEYQSYPCLIIYPKTVYGINEENKEDEICNSINEFSPISILDGASMISGFRDFYKLSVPLPIL